jgi:hypothetical protein
MRLCVDATCLQIVMVHGGVHEVQPGIRKVESRSGVCYFLQ